MSKLVSKFAVLRGDEARLDALSDPSMFADVDENDPRSVAKWARKLGQHLGDDLPSDYGEMVEALGYRIRRLFVGVFVAGSALAGLGGAMWGLYQEVVTAAIGGQVIVLVFIVIIIGGLGSVGGCFVGALLVGLTANYVGFLAPKVALGSNILLMALVLLWRPQGLYPVAKR